MRKSHIILLLTGVLAFSACKEKDQDPEPITFNSIVQKYLNFDLDNLPNYSQQDVPAYYEMLPTNTPIGNPITDKGATLGRVLFYDQNLSVNNTISCASCHAPELGFTDSARFSIGFENGLTGAHSMRLANALFYEGINFFWDKRADNLEMQTTMPIQDPVEMGFDAAHGGMATLTSKMAELEYYPALFEWVYGDDAISEERMQDAMAQFIRSMISSSSKFDIGFAQAFNPNAPGPGQGIGQNFSNFTAQENQGKALFLMPPQNGGAGCAGCHQPPSFALAANSRNNGLSASETVIFKSPSLKNVGIAGPYMHDGQIATLEEVIEHYNSEIIDGTTLDNRLKPNGVVQQLGLTDDEKAALVAFLHTLTDTEMNSDPKFQDPFK